MHFPYNYHLWYDNDAKYKRQYTDKTLTLRKCICNTGADLAFFQGGGGGGGVWPNDEPIFWGLFWTPVSDVFLASTKGGGGLNPIVWGWAWDRVL